VDCRNCCHPRNRGHRSVQLSRHSNGIKFARHHVRPIDAGAGIVATRIRATRIRATGFYGTGHDSGGSRATPLTGEVTWMTPSCGSKADNTASMVRPLFGA
jgi:hypothetical protein